ncbi:hypothetical protein DT075_00065 [Bacillus licheniformis]|nr:hypothetical protein DT075_00065 [Bacillus licheniformis]
MLNGTKIFITNGGIADFYIVFANLAPEQKHKGTTAFIVEKDFPGFSVGKKERKLGIRSSPSKVCASTGVTLSAHTSLAGWPIYAFGTEEQKQEYLKPMARGEKIGAYGLTEPGSGSDAGGMKTTAEMIQKMVRDFAHHEVEPTAKERDEEERFDMELFAKMAELGLTGIPWPEEYGGIGSDYLAYVIAVEELFAGEAVQLLGDFGYTKDFSAERYFRDAKVCEIYEGTSEIQRIVIGKHL